MDENDNKPSDLTIKFATRTAMLHFATWMSELGEQQYWQWMEHREAEDPGDITAIRFDYHRKKDCGCSSCFKPFLEDNTIQTTLGRIGGQ